MSIGEYYKMKDVIKIQISEMKSFEKNLIIRKNIFVYFFVCLAFISPIVFYIFTIQETLSLTYLDEERYNSRMNDSALFALIVFGFALLVISPFLFYINNMFKRYLDFIRTLSGNDIQKLLTLNEKENFFYKYVPSYILRENTVTFFTMFRQNTVNFNDIISINVNQIYNREYQALIVIKAKHNTYRCSMFGNSFKVRDLITEALTVNPKIIIN